MYIEKANQAKKDIASDAGEVRLATVSSTVQSESKFSGAGPYQESIGYRLEFT